MVCWLLFNKSYKKGGFFKTNDSGAEKEQQCVAQKNTISTVGLTTTQGAFKTCKFITSKGSLRDFDTQTYFFFKIHKIQSL